MRVVLIGPEAVSYTHLDVYKRQPDVHFTVGTPGQSCYDAVVSGTKYLIEQGIAHPGKIGLQGHSWSGYQTSYLVTKIDLFTCANIAAPITDCLLYTSRCV